MGRGERRLGSEAPQVDFEEFVTLPLLPFLHPERSFWSSVFSTPFSWAVPFDHLEVPGPERVRVFPELFGPRRAGHAPSSHSRLQLVPEASIPIRASGGHVLPAAGLEAVRFFPEVLGWSHASRSVPREYVRPFPEALGRVPFPPPSRATRSASVRPNALGCFRRGEGVGAGPRQFGTAAAADAGIPRAALGGTAAGSR